MAKKETYREEALRELREILKPGDTVYTILRHVTKSGMTRYIDVFVFRDNKPRYLTYWAKEVLGWGGSKNHEGVKVGGCGMDMGFHLVYSLSRYLYPDGFTCIGEDCPASDHVNGDRDYTPHLHTSGGYALRHRWF